MAVRCILRGALASVCVGYALPMHCLIEVCVVVTRKGCLFVANACATSQSYAQAWQLMYGDYCLKPRFQGLQMKVGEMMPCTALGEGGIQNCWYYFFLIS